MTDPHAPAPRDRLKLAVVCLRIGAVFYALVAIVVVLVAAFVDAPEPASSPDRWFWFGMLAFVAVLSLGLAALSEAIVWGLARRRLWAWVAGLCVFGLYVPSLFFPLGALGLWGLLDPGSRALFGMSQAAAAPQPGSNVGGGSSRGTGCVIAAICGVGVLVFVLPVLGVVAAILVPNFVSAVGKAKQARTVADLRAIALAVEDMRSETGSLPANGPIEVVIRELRPHAAGELPATDAWGHAFRYSCWADDPSGRTDDDPDRCTHYAIASAGRDGRFEHSDPRDHREPPAPGMWNPDADLAVVDGVVEGAPAVP